MKIDVFSIRLSLTEKESDWIKCDTKNYKWQTRLKFHMIFPNTERIQEHSLIQNIKHYRFSTWILFEFYILSIQHYF